MSLRDPQWHDVESTGENTGTEYFGKFNIKPFLNHGERTDALKLAGKLCLGVDDIAHRQFLTALSYLKFHITETEAKWWSAGDGLDLLDEAPVYSIMDKLIEIQTALKVKKDGTK